MTSRLFCRILSMPTTTTDENLATEHLQSSALQPKILIKGQISLLSMDKNRNMKKNEKKTVSEEKYNPTVVSLYAYGNNETN
jgi:hypothetical protein